MLKILKEMQEKRIFKLFEDDVDIDSLIEKAQSDADIKGSLPVIQEYIKYFDMRCTIDYDKAAVNKGISDFCDKFQYSMFDMYINPTINKGCIYEKELSLGTAGIANFGISSSDSIKFTIEERKLLKLINHYYIKLQNGAYLDEPIFYIPVNKLKSIYVEDVNNLLFKESIIETCSKLNSKRVYWNMSNTRYYKTKNLKDKKLDIGKNEKLVDITIIYYPREHSKGIDGKVNTIKGILCKVTNFMKLRYELRQISNSFPAQCLRKNYLDFTIMEKIIYHLNVINANNIPRIKKLQDPKTVKPVKEKLKQNIKTEYKQALVDLLRDLYYYDNEQTNKDYFRMILTEQNSKRRLLEVIKSLSSVAEVLTTQNIGLYLSVKNKQLTLLDESGKPKKAETIHDELSCIISRKIIKGQVLKFIKDKEIGITVNM